MRSRFPSSISSQLDRNCFLQISSWWSSVVVPFVSPFQKMFHLFQVVFSCILFSPSLSSPLSLPAPSAIVEVFLERYAFYVRDKFAKIIKIEWSEYYIRGGLFAQNSTLFPHFESRSLHFSIAPHSSARILCCYQFCYCFLFCFTFFFRVELPTFIRVVVYTWALSRCHRFVLRNISRWLHWEIFSFLVCRFSELMSCQWIRMFASIIPTLLMNLATAHNTKLSPFTFYHAHIRYSLCSYSIAAQKL